MSKQEPTLENTINSIAPDKLEAMREEAFSLHESGTLHLEAANRFQAGLDKVVDVLLILVMKFGRATSMLLVMGGLLVFCLVILVIATTQLVTLRVEVRDLLDKQEEFARSQKRIEATTSETQEKVTSTSKQVAETQQKVDTVAESTPKVLVDVKTGQAKIVVPAKTSKPTCGSCPGPAKPLDKKIEVKLQ